MPATMMPAVNGEFRVGPRHGVPMPARPGVGATIPSPINTARSNTQSSNNGGPRSPPSTAHVPCKFFRQGACQAGNACPFSHDTAAETICKYFAKGNCKFGPKCANIHVLPNGQRVNYGKNGFTLGSTPLALGRQQSSGGIPRPNTMSALTFSLNNPDASSSASFAPSSPYGYDDRSPLNGAGNNAATTNTGSDGNGHQIPTIDVPIQSSSFGGQQSVYPTLGDDDSYRYTILSPNFKGVSALDAPLPASFDSNGISNAARFPAAPWPSSVPSKFGVDSPLADKDVHTSEALQILQAQAFHGGEFLSTTPTASSSAMPASPPGSSGGGLGGEEVVKKRPLHSALLNRSSLMSASVPYHPSVLDDDQADDDDFVFLEEDYVPQNLEDLLTPAEKARRGSFRNQSAQEGEDVGGGSGSAVGTAPLPKFGSPSVSLSSSPSRWSPLYPRTASAKEDEFGSAPLSKINNFGHVGSPLRNSSLASDFDRFLGTPTSSSNTSNNNTHNNANSSFSPSHRKMSGLSTEGTSLSILTQQLQRTRLGDENGSNSPLLHPNSASLRASPLSPQERNGFGGVGPIGSAGPKRTPSSLSTVDTLDDATVGMFAMDDEDEDAVEDEKNHELKSSASTGSVSGSDCVSTGDVKSHHNAPAAAYTYSSVLTRKSS